MSDVNVTNFGDLVEKMQADPIPVKQKLVLWDYAAEVVGTDRLEQSLKARGDAGWELVMSGQFPVSVANPPNSSGFPPGSSELWAFRLIFKRPKQ